MRIRDLSSRRAHVLGALISIALFGCGDDAPPCSVTQQPDGSAIVDCGEGGVVTVPAGTDGMDGAPGTDGASGPTGADGVPGIDGRDGAAGIDGTDGTNGTDGTDGADGRDALVRTSPASLADCPAGGTEVAVGLDGDGDELLSENEVLTKFYLCGGADGVSGADGTSDAARTRDEEAGANCETGGIRIELGGDANANGELDDQEVDAARTRYVCNPGCGAAGLFEPTSRRCIPYSFDLSAGSNFTCGRTAQGEAKCWGRNNLGQLANGAAIDQLSPSPATEYQGLNKALSSGDAHSCAIGYGAGITCAGSNGSGQLGVMAGTSSAQGVTVPGTQALMFEAIDAGRSHTCALDQDRAVWCWGDTTHGQTGAATAGLSEVTGLAYLAQDVSAGGHSSCAVLIDGTAWCWGQNNHGQLGDGTTSSSTSPVRVTDLVDVEAIVMGRAHACALVGDAVYCWGNNSDGQLGDGATTPSTTPIQVAALPSNVISLAAGRAHTCALMSHGTVRCWGDNSDGQLGDSTTTARELPTSVLALPEPAVALTAGDDHTCAAGASGEVYCWGDNLYGQLGTGATNDALIPTKATGF